MSTSQLSPFSIFSPNSLRLTHSNSVPDYNCASSPSANISYLPHSSQLSVSQASTMLPTVCLALLLGLASVTVVHGNASSTLSSCFYSRVGQGGLALSSIAEFPIIPIQEQSLSIVVSFVAPASVASTSRAPVSISAVLDRSGSMSGKPMPTSSMSANTKE